MTGNAGVGTHRSEAEVGVVEAPCEVAAPLLSHAEVAVVRHLVRHRPAGQAIKSLGEAAQIAAVVRGRYGGGSRNRTLCNRAFVGRRALGEHGHTWLGQRSRTSKVGIS